MIYKMGYWAGRLACGLDRALESLRDGFMAGRSYGAPEIKVSRKISGDLAKALRANTGAPK